MNWQYFMWKPGWKENKRIIVWFNINKFGLLMTGGQRMEAKDAAGKCLRQRVKVVYGADNAIADKPLLLRECIDMPGEKRAVAMCDQFEFKLTWSEWCVAKLF
jgi:hypothetical protein